MSTRRKLGAAFAVTALLLVVLAVTPGAPSGTDLWTQSAAAALPPSGSLPAAHVAYHPETGNVRFIGSTPGKPIARPSGLEPTAAPTTVARAFLDRYGGAFGIQEQARELRVTSVRAASNARDVVRFHQVHTGVPVLGGELVANLDRDRNLLSLTGEALPAPDLSVVPRVLPAAARDAALRAVAKARAVPLLMLGASEPTLWIYDSRILGGPGLDRPTLVWRVEVTGEEGAPLDELVLVDAQLGAVALRFDRIEEARNREVCDANNADAQVPCTSPTRIEGSGPSSIQDVNDAYDFSGDTYDFFAALGRDSIDGAGMTLKATTRYCPSVVPPAPCPYPNAYWDGKQMVYGQGFAAADDVVAHELTHGVTQYGSHLFYYYQSGAINESLSDVFGELVDLTNGRGTDTALTRWQLGEDLPVGTIRDMEDPPSFGDPDKMTSPRYTADPDEVDNGGVHTNSGVDNKAAFLITDGGTFNGKTVTGLGVNKAARIYYEADANLLTSASDYADLYDALQQACTNLVGTAGITGADCTQVTAAVQAVEMNTPPPAAPNLVAPVCTGGLSPHDLFVDDLESPASGNWTRQTVSGTNRWFYPQNPNPYGDLTYATSGTTNFWGYDQPATGDYSLALTRSVLVPPGSAAYLRFDHAYGFEDGSANAYDGGVLEFSTNGGVTWLDAGSLLTSNGYNGTIAAGFGNPLAGRSAFVRESNGYISSRASLSSLAGQNVRFRFRIGTDTEADDYGWFVDDIRIYTCVSSAVAPPGAPGNVAATAGNASAQLSWTPPASDGGSPVTNYVITPYVGAVAQATTAVGVATAATVTGLVNGTTYTFTVRAANVAGAGAESPASNPVTPRAPKADQTISFGPLPGKTYGDPDFAVGASASSGLPVSLTPTGSCTISGATVHLSGAGTCTLTASQAGDGNYNPAPGASQSFAIAKASQTILFGPLPSRTYGERDFAVSATASSGLAVAFTAIGSCRVTGAAVHLTGAGMCMLTASQAGDVNFNPAPSVSRVFAIAQPRRLVCRVPKVVGRLLAAARLTIKRSRCRTGAVRYAYSRRSKRGTVISQSRNPGRLLPPNTKISLLVSKGVKKR